MPSSPDRGKLRAEAERRWARLDRDHPELAEAIAAGRAIVALYLELVPPAPPLALSATAARDKLASGIPLLADESLDFDPVALGRFLGGLCDWAAGQPDRAAAGERLMRAFAGGELAAEALLAALLDDDASALAEIAQRHDVPNDFLRSLAGILVSAALMNLARDLAPLLGLAGNAWDAANCPICGGAPLLAEHQGSDGQRVLRCGTCGSGWRFARNRCAGCDTDDPAARHYLAAEGQEEKYRVDLCDRCRGYLISVTSFAPTPPELLTIDDLATLHLAAAARERGYHPVGRGA